MKIAKFMMGFSIFAALLCLVAAVVNFIVGETFMGIAQTGLVVTNLYFANYWYKEI